jgi:hypothetical protein
LTHPNLYVKKIILFNRTNSDSRPILQGSIEHDIPNFAFAYSCVSNNYLNIMKDTLRDYLIS